MTSHRITWEQNDGSIRNCLLIGNGPRFDAWYIFDAVAIDFGSAADTMRQSLKADTKLVEVQFPNGERRRYRNLAAAKRAVEAAA
jgi:hypothetical protein